MTPEEAQRLSRLLFDAWELVDTLGDLTQYRAGKRDAHVDRVRDELAAYRAEQGWSPDGFGGES